MQENMMIQGKIWLPIDKDLPQDFDKKEENEENFKAVIDLKLLDDKLVNDLERDMNRFTHDKASRRKTIEK